MGATTTRKASYAKPYQNEKENTHYPDKRDVINTDKVWWEDPDDAYKPVPYVNPDFLEKGKEQGWAHKEWDELSSDEKTNILTSTLPVWDPEKDQVVLMTVDDACCKDEFGRQASESARSHWRLRSRFSWQVWSQPCSRHDPHLL